MRREPQLRLHQSGIYFCRVGKRDFYFTKDRRTSLPMYSAKIAEWAQGVTTGPTWLTFAQTFFEHILAESGERGPSKKAFYQKHLRRWLGSQGGMPIGLTKVSHLQAFKVGLMQVQEVGRWKKTKRKLLPKTVKHDLDAVRRLIQYAVDLEMRPAINLRAIKNPPQRAPIPHPVDWTALKKGIDDAERADPRLGPWMRLQYLAAMRPSEVRPVVFGEGRWASEGIFVLSKSKMEEKTGVARHIILSEEALAALAAADQCWGGEGWQYTKAMTRVSWLRPNFLRDSAATHLLEAGVALADTRLILGHVEGGAWRSYARPAWTLLRSKAALLSLARTPTPP